LRTFATAPGPDPEPTRPAPCPLCGESGGADPWLAQGAIFVRCPSCGLRRQEPQPRLESVLARYDESYLRYETERHFAYRAIALKSLAEAGLSPSDAATPGARRRAVVEVGCATGALLSAFSDAGWEARGVEVGAAMAAYARDTFGLDVFAGTVEEASLLPRHYDAAVATHLIEHLNDPRAFLGAVRRALRPEGSMYLVTPNVESLQGRLLGERWRSAIRDHLYLFSVRSLKALLRSEGFVPEYVGTWGGWPAGMRPAWLMRPLAALAKRLGLGDVMVVRARLEPVRGRGEGL